MNDRSDHVSVIILNWNGWSDTIECLESVVKSDYANYSIILVDNNSSDGSVEKIVSWANGDRFHLIETKFPHLLFPLCPKPIIISEISTASEIFKSAKENINPYSTAAGKGIVLLHNNQNIGFSKACNQAVKLGQVLFNSQYYFLLNNDTVIENNTISTIIVEMEKHPKPLVITSAIYDYYNPQVISNLGGRINKWGNRKYYNKSQANTSYHPISFATGCALMIPRVIFDRHGLLSEKFFFGEEDFEFSLRLVRSDVRMICLYASKVYHKVSVASKKLLKEGLHKKFIYFFNRSINLKDYYPPHIWKSWRIMISVYAILWLKIKYSVSIKTGMRFSKYLYHCTNTYHDAQQSTINDILKKITF